MDDSYDRALRYAKGDHVHRLLSEQLSDDELQGRGDITRRVNLADVLADEGREHEGHLMRLGTPIQISSEGNIHPDYPVAAWPGAYPLIYFNHHENGFCGNCARDQAELAADLRTKGEPDHDLERSLKSLHAEPHYEGQSFHCEQCGEAIRSAYGDPYAEHDDDDEGE